MQALTPREERADNHPGRRGPESPREYRCMQAAGVTADLEVGEAPHLVRILEPGEMVLVSHVRNTADGKQRAQLSEGGWVSLISESNKMLLEPAKATAENRPTTPTRQLDAPTAASIGKASSPPPGLEQNRTGARTARRERALKAEQAVAEQSWQSRAAWVQQETAEADQPARSGRDETGGSLHSDRSAGKIRDEGTRFPFTPTLDSHSKELMQGRREALSAAGRDGFAHTNYGELLYRDARKRNEQRARRDSEAKRAAEEAEVMQQEECSFTPTLCPKSVVLMQGRQAQRTGVASRATKLELSKEEKLERQTAQIGKIIRDAMRSNRSLGGKAMKNIETVFKAIDKDGSGNLDYDEFHMAMNRLGLGLSPDQIVKSIEVLDKDGDGEVSLEEFMELVKEPIKKATKVISAANAFESAGANAKPKKTGEDKPAEKSDSGKPGVKLTLTAEEKLERQTESIGNVLRGAIRARRSVAGKNAKTIEEVFKAIDKDGSGNLDYDEFHTAMKRLGLGLTPHQLVQLVKVLDVDGDGEVSLEEFMVLVKKPIKKVTKVVSAVSAFASASASPKKVAAPKTPGEKAEMPDWAKEAKARLLKAEAEALPEESKGIKLTLSAAEKLERQTTQISKIIRGAIKSNRSLGGKAVKNIKGVFQAIDKDGSGDLDYDEFKVAMNRLGLGLTDEQIVQCIEVLDKDGDGEVSLEEFMALVHKPVKKAVKAISAVNAFAAAGGGVAGKLRGAAQKPAKPKLPPWAQSAKERLEREARHKAELAETDTGKGIKLTLSADERLERQTTQISKIVRDSIQSKRSLGGKAMNNIEGVFRAIDKDGSGDLDYDEFKTAMKRLGLGLSDTQLVQCIEVLDKDGDGEVSLEEFMTLVGEPIKKATKVISAANAFAEAGKNAGTANSNRLQAAVAHGSAG